MNRKITNVIAGIGFGLLALTVIFGAIIGAMFLFPNLTIFGMVAVNERDTEVCYCDDALIRAFANGNFIVESEHCNVVIRMSKPGYEGENEIIVHQNATGIAFNSRKRTLIEWTRTLVDDVEYFKINITEPSGVVFNNGPTTVYICLKNQLTWHNFILRNTKSQVTFDFSDSKANDESRLNIDNLVVENATKVSIPAFDTLQINHLVVDSDKTNLYCGAKVKNVEINGDNGQQVFDGRISEAITINGSNNKFKAKQVGDLTFKNDNGSISANEVHNLTVDTVNANVNVGKATGHVHMVTQKGNLTLNSVGAGLDFAVNGKDANAKVSVNNSLTGDVLIRNYGVGAIKLNKVAGNVDINSSQIDAGDIEVDFVGTSYYTTDIIGYDGNIKVYNIYGRTNIKMRDVSTGVSAGRANIIAKFNVITPDDNQLITGGYVGAGGIGNIDIYLNNGWNNFNLYAYSAGEAWSYANRTERRLDVGAGKVNAMINVDIGNVGKLTVATPSKLTVR